MDKIKGYEIINNYPPDGWLRGYFYAQNDDLKNRGPSGRAYQDLGYIKHKDYLLHLIDPKKGERILDLGCADGGIMVYCGLLGAEIYGIDSSSGAIEKANNYLTRYGIKGKAIIGDAKKIDFPDNYFDKVVSSDFFEHLNSEDNILALKEAKRILKPNGILVVKTPNLTYLRLSKLLKQIIRLLKLKNPFEVVIAHTIGNQPEHIGLVTRKKIIQLIETAGFTNFRFYYDINSKIKRWSYSIAELFSEPPILREFFTEDIIAVIYKPIILSFFPSNSQRNEDIMEKTV